MDIIHLPHDLFLLIVARLSARTIVLCRRVSKEWNVVFTEQDLNLQLLKDRFPRCRELRLAYSAAAAAAADAAVVADDDNVAASASSETSLQEEILGPKIRVNRLLETTNGIQERDWTSTFALVASRYHHLRTAIPRSLTKIRLGTTGPDDKYRFYGVAIWDRYLRLDDKTAPFHYPDPSWCYAQEEGLLVYHVHPDDVEDCPRTYIYPWRLLDLETGEECEVAFPHNDERVVRRVRFAAGVLVFEWCERLAYHQLNDREECHRHYITAFDLVRSSRPDSPTKRTSQGWETVQRAEWKLHFLGLPLNYTDRFFSTHTATHYAVYVWQPNRSPWGEDDPIESVIIWDMTSPSKPPRIIRRMTWPALAFYGVRQRATPRLRCLGMDERNLFFVEEEHRWAQGGHSSLSPPRVHLVRTTGVPIIPGPVGVESIQTEPTTKDDLTLSSEDQEEERIVHGPHWLDKCGANGDVNLSFCSRLDKPAYLHFVGRSPSSSSSSSSSTISDGSPGIWNGSLPSTCNPTFTHEIRAAIHAPSTRWPGWAPCWRHEEFPYLTVSEMVDFKAGVRVTARHCFMLETLSVHARPSLSVRRGLGGGVVSSAAASSSSSFASLSSSVVMMQEGHDNDVVGVTQQSSVNTRLDWKLKATGKSEKKKRTKGGGGERSVRDDDEEDETMGGDDEVQFADEMWNRLLGKGYICGDERWLIGEDREGSVTIVRF